MSHLAEKLKMRLPAIILLAATLLFWGFYDRYEPAGPVLLDHPSLSEAFRFRGDCTETNSLFQLVRSVDGKAPDIRFQLQGGADYDCIRVEGRMRTEHVVRGRYAWNSARLILIQRNEKNEWVPGPHNLLSEDGTTDWVFQQNEFEIQPETFSAEVVIQQTGESGTAWFDSIRAYPVRIKRSLIGLRLFFGVAWIVVGVIYFFRCRLNQRKLRVLIALNAAVIIAGGMMPGVWIEDSSQYLKKTVVKAFERKAEAPKQPVAPLEKPEEKVGEPKTVVKPEQESKLMDQFTALVGGTHKAGHFFLFASLCFLVYLSAALERQHRSYFIKVAFDLFLFSAITESLQHLTNDRTAGFSDWLIDVYGMATAFIIFLFVLLLAKLMRVSAFDLRPTAS